MSMGVLNNIAATYAANNLSNTQASLQNVLTQLSSGSRINSGADDAAGLSLANGLQANQSALTQSASNVNLGVGLLQTADGALSQVNNLLNRAVTLATEAGNGTLNTSQSGAANQEYQSILAEINNIGAATTYNGQAVFGSATTPASFSIYTSDGTATGTSTDTLSIAALSSAKVGDSGGTIATGAGNAITYTVGTSVDLSTTSLTGATPAAATAAAQAALTAITNAISGVAAQRGYLGSQINTLNSMASVETTQSENLASASNSIMATDYTKATSELSKFQILTQTGISALAQANSTQQAVTKLLQ
ncbi:MAG TPA: flagellin [Acidobacteriaceae bacterium]|jgi:flagellin|nr:flagellin [Acidobacteriaceae bacterium]